MRYLSFEEVILIHAYQLTYYGGGAGVRDVGLIESAIFRPQSTFDSNDLYPTVFEKAAALGCSIINNHPFGDGNKRTGLHTMLTFLKINGTKIDLTNDKLYEIGMGIASDVIEEK
ncbi:type II toxin-antitoxin system death-on-curing family toxin, partial [Patescibacteria group bacterium]